ncbi:MAG: MYXO-CTERM sorting domain-containing protein [Archangium sp.]
MIPSLVALLVLAQPVDLDGGADAGAEAAPPPGLGFSAPREPPSPYSWSVVGCQSGVGVLLPLGALWLRRRRGAR